MLTVWCLEFPSLSHNVLWHSRVFCISLLPSAVLPHLLPNEDDCKPMSWQGHDDCKPMSWQGHDGPLCKTTQTTPYCTANAQLKLRAGRKKKLYTSKLNGFSVKFNSVSSFRNVQYYVAVHKTAYTVTKLWTVCATMSDNHRIPSPLLFLPPEMDSHQPGLHHLYPCLEGQPAPPPRAWPSDT